MIFLFARARLPSEPVKLRQSGSSERCSHGGDNMDMDSKEIPLKIRSMVSRSWQKTKLESMVSRPWLLLTIVLLTLLPASLAIPQSQFEVDRPEWFQRRGIEYFSEGKFKEAIREFNKAIELSPHLEARHWQRGIAYYYAGEFQKGVDQFELHQTVNSQDVENAVWHYICKARLDGIEAARTALIPIELDGRIPMSQVWNLFAETGTVEDVLEAANRFSPHKRQQLCYAHLYLGLYYEALGKSELVKKHINLAANDYSMNNYMGMVAKVHAKTLEE